MKFSFIRYRAWFIGLSVVLMGASVALVLAFGLHWGIDFTGGSLWQATVSVDSSSVLEQTLKDSGFTPSSVQHVEDGSYLVRFPVMSEEEHQHLLAVTAEQYPGATELRFDTVGPSVGESLRRQSVRAVVLLMALIMAYIAWAFRGVSKPVASWKYGLVTALAAIHDVIIPLGAFALLGHFYGYHVDTAFVAAILTILGYSINDTIVVFDRTRENLHRYRNQSRTFGEIVDLSVKETLARSLNTTITTLLPLLAIAIWGGATTRPFVLALMIGIFSGAYSSIFFASPLLTYLVPKK